MPIIACIGMSLIIYILLFHSLKKTEQEGEDHRKEAGIFNKEELTERCQRCDKPYSSNWRYCPYCGNTRENG